MTEIIRGCVIVAVAVAEGAAVVLAVGIVIVRSVDSGLLLGDMVTVGVLAVRIVGVSSKITRSSICFTNDFSSRIFCDDIWFVDDSSEPHAVASIIIKKMKAKR